jgi:hypothetical protein
MRLMRSEVVFNGTNFCDWRVYAKSKLRSKELGHTINGVKGTSVSDKDNDKAIGILMELMEPRYAESVESLLSAQEVWDHIHNLYEQENDEEMSNLRELLQDLTCKKGDNVLEHLAELERIQRRLKKSAAPVTDAELVIRLAKSMPKDWSGFFSSMRASGMDMKIWVNIKKKVLTEISARKSSENDETALNVQPIKQQKCFSCGKTGHYANECTEKKKFKSGRKKKRQGNCNKCGEFGHWARECFRNGYSSANKASQLCVAMHKQAQFYIDSGATDNMVNEKRYLNNFMICKRSILLGDNSMITCKGVGDITISVGNTLVILKNCMYVPELAKKLIINV